MKRMKKILLMTMILLLPLFTDARNHIVICIADYTLTVLSEIGVPLYQCKISYGKNPGNKKVEGDCKTPEGEFAIKMIYDATSWKHDFGDGRGTIEDAYGPYFIRLTVPGFDSIGIHGTCFPESIGTMSTEGCIRCSNEDITKVVKYVSIGSKVIILPDDDLTSK